MIEVIAGEAHHFVRCTTVCSDYIVVSLQKAWIWQPMDYDGIGGLFQPAKQADVAIM